MTYKAPVIAQSEVTVNKITTPKLSVTELKQILHPLYLEIQNTYDRAVFVDIVDLQKEESVGTARSFVAGEAYAWGYLAAKGAVVDDGQELLVIDQRSGKFSIVAEGCISETGEDYNRYELEIVLAATQKARDAAYADLTRYDDKKAKAEEASRTEPDVRGI